MRRRRRHAPAPAPGLWTSEWTNHDRQSKFFFPPHPQSHTFFGLLPIFSIAFNFFFSLDIPILSRFTISPPFCFKVSLILPYTLSFVPPLNGGTPSVLPPPPSLHAFISVHPYIFQSAAFVMSYKQQSFPCNLSVSSHMLYYPILYPRTRST